MGDAAGSVVGGTTPHSFVALLALGGIGALLGAVATVSVGILDYLHKSDELRVHMVEVAVGILRADPKDDVVAARGWALDVIQKYSEVQFSEEDRSVLLKRPLIVKPVSFSDGTFFSDGSGFAPPSSPPKSPMK